MWYKLVQTTNKDLWIIALEKSVPQYRIPFATWGAHCDMGTIKHITSQIVYDHSYFSDADISEIPLHGAPVAPPADPAKVVEPKIDLVKISPHKSSRNGMKISGIVIHNTLGTYESSVAWLTDVRRVRDLSSAHYVVARDGRIARLVEDKDKAWHAGERNGWTIGIEIESSKSMPGVTPVQLDRLNELVKYLMAKYNISIDNVMPHWKIPNTSCPGIAFPAMTFEMWKKQFI
jgi:hypothetical protein